MSIDKSKIPEPLLNEMIELWGEEMVEKVIKHHGYNYKKLTWLVIDHRFKKKYGIRIYPLFVFGFILLFALMISLNL